MSFLRLSLRHGVQLISVPRYFQCEMCQNVDDQHAGKMEANNNLWSEVCLLFIPNLTNILKGWTRYTTLIICKNYSRTQWCMVVFRN
jgi:hypothetical protein